MCAAHKLKFHSSVITDHKKINFCVKLVMTWITTFRQYYGRGLAVDSVVVVGFLFFVNILTES